MTIINRTRVRLIILQGKVREDFAEAHERLAESSGCFLKVYPVILFEPKDVSGMMRDCSGRKAGA